VNGSSIAGNIALVDRGVCAFSIKAALAQAAGAIGVIVADNVAGSPPPALFVEGVTIPVVRITLADGAALKAALTTGSVNVSFRPDPSQMAGADSFGRVRMNAPNPVVPGSSISHFDPVASPNLIMEPSINNDLGHDLSAPADLTLAQMRDIGWYADPDLDMIADESDNCDTVANPDQADNDSDGQGDACDNDDDNDGVADAADNCPFTANSNQLDTDGDGQGNACDTDDDNDGVLDAADNCPLTANADQANYDGDSQGDACDSDDDNDGVADASDAFPFSNMQPTVTIGACNSLAPNAVFPNGATIMDRLVVIASQGGNHGQFVSAVALMTNEAKSLGLITDLQKDAIQSCAGSSK
jgi:hypothetical protein